MLVIVNKNQNTDVIYKSLRTIEEIYGGIKAVVSDFDFSEFNCFVYLDRPSDVNLNKIEDIIYEKLILIGFGEDELIDEFFIYDSFSKGISGIYLYTRDGLKDYNPLKKYKSDTLLVFPGPILPLNMGSHQRAFNLINAINSSDSKCDVLITAGNEYVRRKASRCLQSIAPRVYTYSNKKRKLSRPLRIRKKLEKETIKLLKRNKNTNIAETFSERLYTRATYSLKKTLKRLLDEHDYKTLIISYAWLSDATEFLTSEVLKHVTIICDTHDVQYVRDGSNKNSRYFYSHKFEKYKELKSLEKYDKVIAISVSDAQELKSNIEEDKVLLTTSSFDYAHYPIKVRSNGSPINFGFIGGKMVANIQALTFIIKQWWPSIKAFSPESKLFIAGSICNVDEIRDMCFMDESLVLMGFVNSLRGYYGRFDISLNPVFVQGGLNFKSVEALAAGKILFTNPLGSKCLGDDRLAYIIKNKEDLIDSLTALELDDKFFHSKARMSQNLSFQYFSKAKSYKSLIEVLQSE